MRKQLKSASELESMLMDRVRKNADWWHVKSAIVTPVRRSAPHLPNWDASFVVDGPALRESEVLFLVTALQNHYDLSSV
jgi:hypothetical protein